METVKPELLIDISVSCPKCNYYFDLLKNTNLNEDGDLLKMALPAGCWEEKHDAFECEITCPNCNYEFHAKGLHW